MPDRTKLGVETLERDASALFSFVDSVCQFSLADSESPAYPEPSKRFFEYIKQLGDATKEYLSGFAAKRPSKPELYQYYRQRLETIRLGWFEFHLHVKAAADADTLNVPYALVEALTTRLRSVSGFDKTTFAIFHIDELNYWEIPSSAIKETTDKFKRYIPQPPRFPANTGMIGIPYSQSSSLYLNFLIAHEMGHFVFEKLQLKDRLLPHIETALKTVMKKGFEAASDEDLQLSKDRLSAWAEEMFCDLFAVWLIGPCYCFAYIELFGLTTILDDAQPSGFSVTAGAGSTIFTPSHPADLLRLKQQVLLLQKLRWWPAIESIKSHYVSVLSSSQNVQRESFGYRDNDAPLAEEAISGFMILSPHILNAVTDIMKDANGKKLDSRLNSYRKFNDEIGKYLVRAVVPSTVFLDGQHWYPDEITLLNASTRLYLESLENLMEGVEEQNPHLPSHRSNWTKRLEALTTKAIEDHSLLVRERGAESIGGYFKRANLQAAE
ncbi:MAG TPA: hypothetical protein VMU45_07285 [Candidatus Eisenbacteria bacterium]|nr:hypothetical protein [Candidatus Eisenbacteria bacterium]